MHKLAPLGTRALVLTPAAESLHHVEVVIFLFQIIHESVYDTVKARMLAAYASVPRGDPLVEGTLLGPLHTKGAIKEYTDGLEEIAKQGGRVLIGGRVVESGGGNWVEPTIVEIDPSAPIVKTELFVPILYIMKFKVGQLLMFSSRGADFTIFSQM